MNSAVVTLLFIGLLLYSIAPLIRILNAPKTAVVEEYIMQDTYTLHGIIVREETLIPDGGIGTVTTVKDGQAVAAGARIAIRGDQSVIAPIAGIYLTQTDGLEHLTADSLSELTPRAIDRLLQTEPVDQSRSGKIISGNSWLIAAAADTDCSKLLQKGHSIRLNIRTEAPFELTAVVLQVSPAENNRYAVVFRCIDHLQSTAHLRHLTVTINGSCTQGLRIPQKAIHTDENGSFVYRDSASGADQVYITIMSEEDDCIVVSKDSAPHALHAGDMIILSSPNL